MEYIQYIEAPVDFDFQVRQVGCFFTSAEPRLMNMVGGWASRHNKLIAGENTCI